MITDLAIVKDCGQLRIADVTLDDVDHPCDNLPSGFPTCLANQLHLSSSARSDHEVHISTNLCPDVTMPGDVDHPCDNLPSGIPTCLANQLHLSSSARSDHEVQTSTNLCPDVTMPGDGAESDSRTTRGSREQSTVEALRGIHVSSGFGPVRNVNCSGVVSPANSTSAEAINCVEGDTESPPPPPPSPELNNLCGLHFNDMHVMADCTD